MRKVILYIAQSLDGFIAEPNGSIDWLRSFDDNDEDYGYQTLMQSIDTVIMGMATYHQLTTELAKDNWPYTDKQCFVFSHRLLPKNEQVTFIKEDVIDFVEGLRQTTGEAIWICGGASIVNQLVKAKLIDEYHITVIPLLLGQGIRLFSYDNPRIDLNLTSWMHKKGIVQLVYQRK